VRDDRREQVNAAAGRRARPRVRLLDPDTVDRIAAGEVVERPASVVKELVENSLDAGAARISVEIERGGTRLIRVRDDGCGMDEEDAELAIERHATSKIGSIGDLSSLLSLGFRGEALPSIARVSRMELVTRAAGSETGHRLVVEGGAVRERSGVGCPVGTIVIVRDLFFNTPARRKQLRRQGAEAARVAEALYALILSRPDVAFEFRRDGRPAALAPGTGRLEDVLVALYGPQFTRSLARVSFERSPITVRGFVGSPGVHRARGDRMFFFVNGRPVRSRLLARAVEDGLSGFLPRGRRPVTALSVGVPPAEVDVNVHPAKMDVRFADPGGVLSAVAAAVRHAASRSGAAGVDDGMRAARRAAGAAAARSGGARKVGRPPAGGPAPTPDGWPYAAAQNHSLAREQVEAWGPCGDLAAGEPVGTAETSPGLKRALELGLRPVGQVLRAYIVAEGGGSLYLIDQHAAHERVYYERLLEPRGRPRSQPLLEPIPVELSASERFAWEEARETWESLGFAIEPFGGRSVLVRALPSALADGAAAGDLASMFGSWAEESGPAGAVDARRRAAAAAAACKAAVKSREPLTGTELGALLEALSRCEAPHTCPHGRPTAVRIDRTDLERWFGRTGSRGGR